MNKNLALWQLAGLTFTAVLGTLLHFLYAWTGSIALAPFSAVNESTFEHMKILFFPMLFFAFIESRFLKEDFPCFWQVKAVGVTLGTLLIPILFYTYNGAFGKSPDWLNIFIFFVAAGVAYFVETQLFKREQTEKSGKIRSVFAKILLTVWAILFIFFTFAPPALPLFQDPTSNLYGLQK